MICCRWSARALHCHGDGDLLETALALPNHTKPNIEDLAKLIRQVSNIDRSLSEARSQDTQYRRRCEVTMRFDMMCSPRQEATVAQPILVRTLIPLGQALRDG